VIGQNTHSRNIFSVHGFLNLSVINKRRAPNKRWVRINAGSTRPSFKETPPAFNRENAVYVYTYISQSVTINCKESIETRKDFDKMSISSLLLTWQP